MAALTRLLSMGWGWGDWWGAFCIAVAVIAASTGDLGSWWIFLAVTGVGGYFGLNVLQASVRDEEDQG